MLFLFGYRLRIAAYSLFLGFGMSCFAATWLPYGPDGGDARTFAADPANPAHVYLGTASGWIYETLDAGGQWKRLARVGKRDDLVLDTILVDAADPRHVTVGAWVLDHADGGIYQSHDAGRSWVRSEDMAGQSVRSLASAPSDPKVMVAGTLSGVFRTADAGSHWQRISPPESAEIHEVQSLAVDPLDPDSIYAGTWHLPWKTTDGGQTWFPIKQGVIDDSDVFSIVVDPHDPRIVFVSACSGIYKSEDRGGTFRKVQGIPSTARRTLVLMQDPEQLQVVFAGTTEGLWRTDDAGATWARMTGPEVIVNDVYINPTDSQKVLLATDRGGVLTSTDGGKSFAPANRGFSARQITALVSDPQKTGRLFAGLVNDKEWGGVFVSDDGGLSWRQHSEGLNGLDVFSLGESKGGVLLAGTAHGIYRLEDEVWSRVKDEGQQKNEEQFDSSKTPTEHVDRTARPAARVAVRAGAKKGRSPAKEITTRRPAPRSTVVSRSRHSAPAAHKHQAAVPKAISPAETPSAASSLGAAIHAVVAGDDALFAASSQGVWSSDAEGVVWHAVSALGSDEWRFLAASGRLIVAARADSIMRSTDGGATWAQVESLPKVTQITALAVDARGELWVGGREGVYLSSDQGMSWQTLKNLYVRDVDSLYFDPASDQVFVTSNGSATVAFAVEVSTRKVSFWDTGWNLRFVRPVGDHLLAATLFDGIVVQPQMVEAKGAGAF